MNVVGREATDDAGAAFPFRLYAVFVACNAAAGFAGGLHLTSNALVALASMAFWAVVGQALTPVVLGNVLFGGPPVMSHDVLPRDIVGPAPLAVMGAILAAGLLARGSAPGRWMSYGCVAVLTLAAGANLFGWIEQGL